MVGTLTLCENNLKRENKWIRIKKSGGGIIQKGNIAKKNGQII